MKNNNKNNFGHIYMAVSILFQDFHTLLFSNEVVIFIEHSTFERQKFFLCYRGVDVRPPFRSGHGWWCGDATNIQPLIPNTSGCP